MVDLVNILKEDNLYESIEYIKEYRSKFNEVVNKKEYVKNN